MGRSQETGKQRTSVRVQASWDDEAKWWVAESDDVPGLAAGAATWSELVSKLNVLVPQLLELNAPGRALPDEIVVESAERIPVKAGSAGGSVLAQVRAGIETGKRLLEQERKARWRRDPE